MSDRNTTGTHQKANVDRFVQQYLISQGYSQAAAAMENEMGKGTEGSSSSLPIDMLINNNVAETMFVKGSSLENYDIYMTQLDIFSSWVLHSLDVIKPYLLAVNFAVFCHCYISLIRDSKSEEALKILQTFEFMFGQLFYVETKHLSVLLRAEQLSDTSFLSSNLFIGAAIKGKFRIKMSPLALSLLTQKLKEDDLILIAAIINDKIVFERLPVTMTEDPVVLQSIDLLSLPGYDRFDDGKDILPQLRLGVLGAGEALKHWQERSALFQDIDFPDLANDPLMEQWVKRIIRPRLVLKKFVRQDGSIPPSFEGQQLDTLLQDSEKSFTPLYTKDEFSSSSSSRPMGDALNPSVVFATLANAYEDVTSLDINPTVTQAVSGHGDCILRVWRLDQQNEEHEVNPWFGRNLPPPHEWSFNDVLPKPKKSTLSSSSASASSAAPQPVLNSMMSSNNSITSAVGGQKNHRRPKNAFASCEFIGHSQPIMAVSQSKDERLILSCSVDETIRLWDTAIIQCVGRYNCFSTPWDVKFSPFQDYFASGNADRSITVYTTDRESPIRLMTGHTGDVNCVSWHGNGQFVASGSDDCNVRFWDLRSTECVRTMRHCSSPITSVQVSNIGNLIAAGTEHGRIYLWDIRSTRQLAILQGHEGSVHSLSFAHGTAPELVSGGADCTVRIWDLTHAVETSYRAPPITKAGQEAYAVTVLSPKHAFHTKACPVLKVGYTAENMIYAGGSFSHSAANVIREKNSSEGAQAVAEQWLIRSFGMQSVVPTKATY